MALKLLNKPTLYANISKYCVNEYLQSPTLFLDRTISTTLASFKDKVSSNLWLERQRKDIFVKQAGAENYRCRSAFKLKQINERFSILRPGHTVIDCGAAPGSWCQVAVQEVNATGEDTTKPKGIVIGVDLQYMSPVEGAIVLPLSDFTTQATQLKIKEFLGNKKADVLLSDMAPRATGLKSHNHEVIVELCYHVLRFALVILNPRGTMLCKLWMGGDQKKLETAMETVFEHVRVVKPEASRAYKDVHEDKVKTKPTTVKHVYETINLIHKNRQAMDHRIYLLSTFV